MAHPLMNLRLPFNPVSRRVLIPVFCFCGLSARAQAAAAAGAVSPGTGWWIALLVAALGGGGLAWYLDRNTRRRTGLQAMHALTQVNSLIEHVDGLLWEARVLVKPDGMEWDLTLRTSALSRRIFGNTKPSKAVGLWYAFKVPERAEMDQRAREAMEKGLAGYQQDFRLVGDRTIWIHESVLITPTGSNEFWLVGLATETTMQREAERARNESQAQLGQLLAHANCMLWQARVTRDAAGNFDWQWYLPRSELYHRIAGEDPGQVVKMPWSHANVPEFAELENRSRDAMLQGLSGYDQIFRVLLRGEVLWMHEQAQIRPTGPNEWSLEGVVIDITAQKRAEDDKTKSEQHLAYLLERADCLIWQAKVCETPAGEFQWATFIPRSQLFRRIFNRDPGDHPIFYWQQMGVPEFAEMKDRSREAMLSGASGYAQVFHVPKPEGNIWLSERTSIRATGPGEWELVGIIADITARHEAE